MKKNLLTIFVLLTFSGVALATETPDSSTQETALDLESQKSILHEECLCSESPNSANLKLLKKDANLVEHHELFLKRMEAKLLYDIEQLLKTENITDDYWLIKQLNVILADLEPNTEIYNQFSDFIKNITSIRDDSKNVEEFEAKKKTELPKIKEILISIRDNSSQYVRQGCICNDKIRSIVENCESAISKLEKNIEKGKLEKVKTTLLNAINDISEILSNSAQEKELLSKALAYIEHATDSNVEEYKSALIAGIETLKGVISTINLELKAEDRLKNLEAKRLFDKIVDEYVELGFKIKKLEEKLVL